jgi:hypothetical protein
MANKFNMVIRILNIPIVLTLLNINSCSGTTYGSGNGTEITTEPHTVHDNTIKHEICPNCWEGSRSLFRIADKNRSIVLICDECNSIWINPNEVGWGHTASDNDLKVRFNVKDSEDLFDENSSGWAALKEVMQSEWKDFIKLVK